MSEITENYVTKICLHVLGTGIFQKKVFNSILISFQLGDFNMMVKFSLL